MGRYDDLIARARAGEAVVIDGATGSECLRRGVPLLHNGWSGGAALTHPYIVKGIHADYIACGADLIAANTFAAGRNVLDDAGVGDDFAECNRRAIELAIEARSDAGPSADHVVVAGGVSNWSFSGNRPSHPVLYDNTVEQVAIMRDAGAELLSLEMMVDIPRMTVTLDAVSTVDLPVWVGLTIGPEEGFEVEQLEPAVQLREGGTIAEAIEVARTYANVDAFCLMHSDVRLTERGVAEIRKFWDGPIGAYAHSARYHDGELIFEDNVTPAQYGDYVPDWAAAGACMVGGCCGIGPAYIEKVFQRLKS